MKKLWEHILKFVEEVQTCLIFNYELKKPMVIVIPEILIIMMKETTLKRTIVDILFTTIGFSSRHNQRLNACSNA